MSEIRKFHPARERLNAILRVYEHGESVSKVCSDLGISRVTWYDWLNQLKAVIQPVWGGFAKKSKYL